MAISFFSGDATRTDSYVDATVQISGYHITEEIYGGRILVYPDQFAIVIKQIYGNIYTSVGLIAANLQLALSRKAQKTEVCNEK